jgi:hypothetical protein
VEENTSIERNTNVRRKTSTNQYLQLESKPKSRYFLKPNSYINISENNLNLVIHVNEDMDVRLLHFSCAEYNPKQIKKDSEKWFRLVEIQASGENGESYRLQQSLKRLARQQKRTAKTGD